MLYKQIIIIRNSSYSSFVRGINVTNSKIKQLICEKYCVPLQNYIMKVLINININ